MTEELKAWKAIPIPWDEYNELKEKAEKWDGLPYYLQEILKTHKSEATLFGKINKDYRELEDKLEAVENLVEGAPSPDLLWMGDPKRRYSLFLIQLKEILGAEE